LPENGGYRHRAVLVGTRAESNLLAVIDIIRVEEDIDPIESLPGFVDDAQERHPSGLGHRGWLAVAVDDRLRLMNARRER